MERYAEALVYAVPSFMALILLEYLVSRWKGVQVYRAMDTISSISCGITMILRDLAGLTVVIISYEWMVERIALVEVEPSPLIYVLTIVGLDFAGYWAHRATHKVNVLWNRHIVHHSSEEYNLACALRLPISKIVSIFFLLYAPLALLGVPASVVAFVSPFYLFAQFWYHTRLIGNMGFLEHIIMTPSHHRVHHAINDEYIDKNYSQIFIIWDKLFGTFQAENPANPPVYGTRKPVRTWNPIVINFMHLWVIIKDAWRTRRAVDKIKIWFMPTGWRPEDLNSKSLAKLAFDPLRMKKYETEGSLFQQSWSWVQLGVSLALMYYMIAIFDDLEPDQVTGYSVFLAVTVFANTSLMDGRAVSLYAEGAKVVVAAFLVAREGGWFGIDQVLPGLTSAFFIYLALSFALSIYFRFIEKDALKTPVKSPGVAGGSASGDNEPRAERSA